MKKTIACMAVSFIVSLFSVPCDSAESRVFKAGAAAVDITPTVLNRPNQGNGIPDIADNVRDPLHARCLMLDDGKERFLLLVVDIVYFDFPVVERLKEIIVGKTGIPKDRIMVSGTHTHSAPSLRMKAQEGEKTFTLENMAQAAVEAQKNLAPAKIGWAVGNDPKNVFCRRFLMREGTAPIHPANARPDRAMMNPGVNNPNRVSPTGPVDSLIPVISILAPDGMPVAVFANYSNHHAWKGLGRKDMSADRFGVFCGEIKRKIAEKVGKDKMSDKFVAIMANGTCGDANCYDYLDPKRVFDYRTVGRDNAEAAMVVWPIVEYHDWVPLGMTERRLKLPGYRPKPEEVEKSKKYLADKNRKVVKTMEGSVKNMTQPELWKETVEVPLQAMRIGELGMTTLPGEFFGISGIELKAKSPFQPTMNIGLANAGYSYVPPPEQFDLGGYATWRLVRRCLDVDAEPTIKRNLLEMLGELRNAK